jgi:hypothetical protein
MMMHLLGVMMIHMVMYDDMMMICDDGICDDDM